MFRLITAFLLTLSCHAQAAYNGLLERADEQFSRRGYDSRGIRNAEDGAFNYEKVFTRLMGTLEADFAQAKYLRANYFVATAKLNSAKDLLFEGMAVGKRSILSMQTKYGRDMSKAPSRAKKIYSELVYYHALTVREYIKAGGSARGEWKQAETLLNALPALGYAQIADSGPDQLKGLIQFEAGQFSAAESSFARAFDQTRTPLHPTLSRIGLVNYYYAQSLMRTGKDSRAREILADFAAADLFELSLDWLAENRMFQGKSRQALHLQKLGEPRLAGPIARPEWVEGEYLVKLRPNVKPVWSKPLKADSIRQVVGDIFLVKFDPAENRRAAFLRLMNSSDFQIVEPNFLYFIDSTPNDPKFHESWGLHNTGQVDSKGLKGVAGVDIKALEAWGITTGSKEVIVGIVDTGVDFSHPDLAPNAWVNEVEARGQPGVDDDGNGYVDDLNGFDFPRKIPQQRDDHGHGTHVAGVIGARGHDGAGIAGINWNVRIMALKFLGNDGAGSLAGAIEAINFGTKMGAKILNNSWGTGQYSELLKQTIAASGEAGVLFIAAAGNSGRSSDDHPEYPSAHDLPSIISVAALDNRGRLAKFSNYGKRSVHIAAPGENILSTLPNNGYDAWSGTSMAVPFVAGTAALLLAKDPGLTFLDLKARLLKTASPLRSLVGKIGSEGMVNAAQALRDLPAPADPNDPARWAKIEVDLDITHPYADSDEKVWSLHVSGARALSIHFSKIQLESGYDRLYVLDKNKNTLAVLTDTRESDYSDIIEGDTVLLRLSTDATVNDFGFSIDSLAYR